MTLQSYHKSETWWEQLTSVHVTLAGVVQSTNRGRDYEMAPLLA